MYDNRHGTEGEMTMKNTIETIQNKQMILERALNCIANGGVKELLSLFSEKDPIEEKRLFTYIGDTREVLDVILDYFNKNLAVGEFFFKRETSVSNPSTIYLSHPRYNIFMQIWLTNRKMSARTSYFAHLYNKQKQFHTIKSELQTMKEKLKKELNHVEEMENRSTVKVFFSVISKEDVEEYKESLEKEQEKVEEKEKEFQEYFEYLMSETEFTSDFHTQFKEQLKKLVDFGFTHEIAIFNEKKHYRIYNRTFENHHFSSINSVCDGLTCILDESDWDLNDLLRDGSLTPKQYTDEEFEEIEKAIEFMPSTFLMKVKTENGNEFFIEGANATYMLAQNGILTVIGHKADANVFDLISNERLAKAIFTLHEK